MRSVVFRISSVQLDMGVGVRESHRVNSLPELAVCVILELNNRYRCVLYLNCTTAFVYSEKYYW